VSTHAPAQHVVPEPHGRLALQPLTHAPARQTSPAEHSASPVQPWHMCVAASQRIGVPPSPGSQSALVLQPATHVDIVLQ
jgi:hypothetical protein